MLLIKNNRLFLFFFLSVIAIQSLLMFQGFDVCDDGFVLTFYQQFFQNPSSVEYNFIYYLGGLVGGVWNSFFGSLGILGFRILATIVNSLCFVLTYIILKPYFKNKFHLLIGILVVLFVNEFGFLSFYHNHLTQLLLLISFVYFQKFFISKKNLYLFLGAFVIGVNVWSRAINISFLAFYLIVPFIFFTEKHSLKYFFKRTYIFVFGIALGIISILGIIFILNQQDVLYNSFSSVFKLGQEKDTSHNFVDLIKYYIKTNFYALKTAGLVLLFTIAIFKIYIKKNIAISRIRIPVIVMSIGMFLFFSLKNTTALLYGISFLTIFIVLTDDKYYSKEIKFLVFLGGLMLLLCPLGSGLGVDSSGYIALWITFPMIFLCIEGFKKNNALIVEPLAILKFTFIFSFFLVKIYQISTRAYFDKGFRWEKTHIVNSEFSERIYTTKKRADIINDLIKELKNYVKPNDYLLVYDNIPMIHYLTQTRPYVYNPWISLYDSNSFKSKLKKAENEAEVLPVIVQQKFKSIGMEFGKPNEGYMDTDKKTHYYDNDIIEQTTLNFIKNNNYNLAWSNEYFNIYSIN